VDKKIIWLYVGDDIPLVVMTELKAFKKIMEKYWFPTGGRNYLCTYDFRVRNIKRNKNTRLEDYLIDIEVRNFKVTTTAFSPNPKYYLDITGRKPNRAYIRTMNNSIRLYSYHKLMLYLQGFGIKNGTNYYTINKINYI
jgi:hypothetical protein